ncbi:MAG: GGDEF domain-containing protein, partial [Novosphingobium sp.]|nr:GGDEF domain-containing protein [Novosphingobium sp.]
MVETLYTQPTSLAIGAGGGIMLCVTAAYRAQTPPLTVAAFALTIVALLRVITAFLLPKPDENTSRRAEILFEIGAFSYAFLVGLVAALAITLDVPVEAKLLAVVNAVAYGVGIAPRNAGRPVIAAGQLTFALVPVVTAFAIQDDIAYKILALNIALLVPAMMSIALNVFKTLRNSIAAAETSARLAEKMQTLARSDVVTGLLNRAGLNHDLVERLATLDPDEKLALFWMDLDKFKEVNDALGHQVGDRLLAEVASRLRNVTPENATVARFGGDEF